MHTSYVLISLTLINLKKFNKSVNLLTGVKNHLCLTFSVPIVLLLVFPLISMIDYFLNLKFKFPI